MNNRLYIEKISSALPGTKITLSGENSKYVKKIIRLVSGENITIFDGSGKEYLCKINELESKKTTLTVESIIEIDRESPLEIILCQALPKSKKMDLILQKGVELGVKKFIPFISSRVISRKEDTSDKKKRWHKIIREATRQCGRTFIPELYDIQSFDDLLKILSSFDKKTLKIVPWEEEKNVTIENLSLKFKKNKYIPEKIVLLIGPEGGFSQAEIEKTNKLGLITVSLGKRLLRTETAGLATVSIIQFIWGDIS